MFDPEARYVIPGSDLIELRDNMRREFRDQPDSVNEVLAAIPTNIESGCGNEGHLVSIDVNPTAYIDIRYRGRLVFRYEGQDCCTVLPRIAILTLPDSPESYLMKLHHTNGRCHFSQVISDKYPSTPAKFVQKVEPQA